jgi:hypothetical protein
MIRENQILKSVVLSAVATLIGILLAFVYSAQVPQQVGCYVDQEAIDRQIGQVISEQEWKRRQKQSERLYEEAKKNHIERQNQMSTSDVFHDIKSHGFVVAWIPWLFIPFVMALNFRAAASLLIVPLVLIPLGLVVWYEIILYLLIVVAGYSIKKTVFKSNNSV